MVVDGESSGTTSVDSGVPQGSVLGPLLFLIYIDGIANTNLSPGSEISLYADDMMLFKVIKSNADYADLQNDIDGLNNWVTANYLTFSSSKCKYMLLSRKKNPSHPPALKLGSSALDRVHSYRYLGVLLTSTLCWSEHINEICSRAKRMVGLLYRRFYQNTSPQSLFQLYIALVRPHTSMLARFGILICKRTSISSNAYRSSLCVCVQNSGTWVMPICSIFLMYPA